jgi:hypothetical protein
MPNVSDRVACTVLALGILGAFGWFAVALVQAWR